MSTSPQIVLSSITAKLSPGNLLTPGSTTVTATIISAQDAARLKGTHSSGMACADVNKHKSGMATEGGLSAPPSEQVASTSSATQVGLLDLNYHGSHKEYNLRRSRSKTGSPRPGGKADSTAAVTGKRTRSDDDTESTPDEVAAKKMKVDEVEKLVDEGEVLEEVKIVMEENASLRDEEIRECKESQGEALKEEPASKPPEEEVTTPKVSPPKRKSSVTLNMRSRKKQKVGAAKKRENLERASTVCALCMKRDSELNLGFLYGPYKQLQVKEVKEVGKSEEEKVEASKPADQKRLLWVHESCAVWAPGVCLVGGKLLGLHDAVNDGEKLVSWVGFV